MTGPSREPFRSVTSAAVPFPRNDIDTDQIIPARFLKTVNRAGLGDQLFFDWRYLAVAAGGGLIAFLFSRWLGRFTRLIDLLDGDEEEEDEWGDERYDPALERVSTE